MERAVNKENIKIRTSYLMKKDIDSVSSTVNVNISSCLKLVLLARLTLNHLLHLFLNLPYKMQPQFLQSKCQFHGCSQTVIIHFFPVRKLFVINELLCQIEL